MFYFDCFNVVVCSLYLTILAVNRKTDLLISMFIGAGFILSVHDLVKGKYNIEKPNRTEVQRKV